MGITAAGAGFGAHGTQASGGFFVLDVRFARASQRCVQSETKPALGTRLARAATARFGSDTLCCWSPVKSVPQSRILFTRVPPAIH
jgi:hypothetical protein